MRLRVVKVVTLLVTFCSADFYSSTADVLQLARLEQSLVPTLEKYEGILKARLDAVNDYLSKRDVLGPCSKYDGKDIEDCFRSLPAKHDRDPSHNPILSYAVIKLVAHDHKELEEFVAKQDLKEIKKEVLSHRKKKKFPTKDDYYGAARALVRVQDVYDLNVTELSEGIIQGRKVGKGLASEDCVNFANGLFKDKVFTRGFEWAYEAKRKAFEEKDKAITETIVAIIKKAEAEHDSDLTNGIPSPYLYRKTLSETPWEEQHSKKKQDLELERQFYRPLSRSQATEDKSITDDLAYSWLCQGKELLKPELKASLKCHLHYGKSHYLKLMPVKTEQHYMNPDVYTVYDVISHNQIEHLKNQSLPLMQRANVFHSKKSTEGRTEKVAWLQPTDPTVRKILRKIYHITGLSLRGAEPLQVGNYGLGGQYFPHFDSVDVKGQITGENKEYGDRAATYMLYLSDVEMGGNTVFPRIGVGIQPVKGAAVFWHNVRRNGKPDYLTLHGGCPVLMGSKWVANEWLQNLDQAFWRPCSLSRNE